MVVFGEEGGSPGAVHYLTFLVLEAVLSHRIDWIDFKLDLPVHIPYRVFVEGPLARHILVKYITLTPNCMSIIPDTKIHRPREHSQAYFRVSSNWLDFCLLLVQVRPFQL